MSEYRIIKRIGNRWREESRDVVEAALPGRLRELLDRIAVLETADELDPQGGTDSRVRTPAN